MEPVGRVWGSAAVFWQLPFLDVSSRFGLVGVAQA